MPIKISCSKCPVVLTVRDELIGKAVKCPKCQSIVAVPPGDPAPSTAQAAAETKRPPSSLPGKAPAAALSKSRSSPAPRVEQPREEEPVRKSKRPAPPDEDEPAPRKKSSRSLEKLEEVRPRKHGRDEDDDGDAAAIPEFKVPEKYREQIEEELSKGEKMLWCGQPARRVVMVRAILFFCILGSLLFIFAAVFLVIGLVGLGKKGNDVTMFLLPGGLFMVISIGMMLMPIYKIWQAGRTCYVLTNRRAIVWACNWYGGINMENYNPAQVVNMFRRDMWFFGKGAGDLVFKTVTVITTTHHHGGPRNAYRGSSTSATTYYYGFLSVENVRQIEKMVRECLVDKLVDKLTS